MLGDPGLLGKGFKTAGEGKTLGGGDKRGGADLWEWPAKFAGHPWNFGNPVSGAWGRVITPTGVNEACDEGVNATASQGKEVSTVSRGCDGAR